MTKEQMQMLWDDLHDLREDVKELRRQFSRLYWASVAAAVAIGGPQLLDRILSWVG